MSDDDHSTSGTEFPSVTKKFKVASFGDGCVWMKLLEGDKKGLEFAIIADEYREKLTEGQIVDATVQSLNARNTKWRIHSLNTESDQ